MATSKWEETIQKLVALAVEPYMNSYPEVAGREVCFRRIAGAKSPYPSVNNKAKVWSEVIVTLGLDSEEDVARVRKIIRQRIPKKPR